MRGGRATAKLMRPLGFPNLVKAREAYKFSRLRQTKASYPVQIVLKCPCNRVHTMSVDEAISELTPAEKAIIAGMSLAKLKAYKVTDNLR